MVSTEINGSGPPSSVQLIDEDCNFKYPLVLSSWHKQRWNQFVYPRNKVRGIWIPSTCRLWKSVDWEKYQFVLCMLLTKVHYLTTFLAQSSTLWMRQIVNRRLRVIKKSATLILGIWLSKALNSDILIMDVEGTDSRERGDEQVVKWRISYWGKDFERRSALFSLAISEVIIVNLWEQQVGLYQGANMGLLKTVLEVNLQLFQQQRGYLLPPEKS